MFIKEIIVVEGKNDVAAVKKAVDAECVVTNGLRMGTELWKVLETAYIEKGIVVLTDPDTPGEYIRKEVTKRFPKAKHAFVAKKNALKNNDVGIEQASPESIRSALEKAHCVADKKEKEFLVGDLLANHLAGCEDAAFNREILGNELGIGYANAKQFLARLNAYGISRKKFEAVLSILKRSNV